MEESVDNEDWDEGEQSKIDDEEERQNKEDELRKMFCKFKFNPLNLVGKM